MPDVTEFLRAFGLRTFVGWIGLHDDTNIPDMSYSLFSRLNEYFVGNTDPESPWATRKTVPHGLVTAYYTKHVYWGDPSGESWHTPLTGFYSSDADKFYITKGWNKIMAARLGRIQKLPIIASAYQKLSPRSNMRKIKNDQDLRSFVNEVAKNQPVESPMIGFDFLKFENQISVPVIHYLDINQKEAERPEFPGMFANDQRIWKRWYPGRLVVSDVLPSATVGYDHKKLTGVHPDIEHIRAAMPESAVAYICADRDPDICARLTEALVWLSSDQHGHKVGEVRSADGRYRIVYNNNCNDCLIMPPGLYK